MTPKNNNINNVVSRNVSELPCFRGIKTLMEKAVGDVTSSIGGDIERQVLGIRAAKKPTL